MDPAKFQPGSILEDHEGYSRIVMLDNWIFISLTSSLNFTTRVMADTTLERAQIVMKKVEGPLAVVGASLPDVVRRRTFVTRQEGVPDAMAYMERRWFN
jgi:enamine deaminase RidA (YjgF/YER057c/UK114 family)